MNVSVLFDAQCFQAATTSVNISVSICIGLQRRDLGCILEEIYRVELKYLGNRGVISASSASRGHVTGVCVCVRACVN